MFSALTTGIVFDVFVKVDIDKLTFEYGNNTTSGLVLLGLILTCIILVCFDFWLERLKIKERTNKQLLDAIRDSKVSNSIKREIIRLLHSKK